MSVWLRVLTLPFWNIVGMRKASFGPAGRLTSEVMRTSPLDVTEADASTYFCSEGFFRTWLITPPVEPRPNSIDDGPISTSICSSANVSR
jgi:hypothetical protein